MDLPKSASTIAIRKLHEDEFRRHSEGSDPACRLGSDPAYGVESLTLDFPSNSDEEIEIYQDLLDEVSLDSDDEKKLVVNIYDDKIYFGDAGTTIKVEGKVITKTYEKNKTTIEYSYYLDKVGNEVLHGAYFKFNAVTKQPLLGVCYKDGILDGDYISLYEKISTPKVQCMYKEGVLHGLYRAYHKNLRINFKMNYINGKLHGEYQEINKEGDIVVEAMFKDDMQHGYYRTYYDNKILHKDYIYDHGTPSGKFCEFYNNGNLEIYGSYTNGVYVGRFIHFHRSGRPKAIIDYHNNEFHGEYEEFYDIYDEVTQLQPLKLQQIYHHGKLDGMCIHYAPNYMIRGNTMLQEPVSIRLYYRDQGKTKITELTMEEFCPNRKKVPIMRFDKVKVDNGVYGILRPDKGTPL